MPNSENELRKAKQMISKAGWSPTDEYHKAANAAYEQRLRESPNITAEEVVATTDIKCSAFWSIYRERFGKDR